MIQEVCLCGHLRKEHELNHWKIIGLNPTYPDDCYAINACYHLNSEDTDCYCKGFQPDNLKLIEDLATLKGLI